jgi:hypothetical protein
MPRVSAEAAAVSAKAIAPIVIAAAKTFLLRRTPRRIAPAEPLLCMPVPFASSQRRGAIQDASNFRADATRATKCSVRN